jgi:hypothetical protein
MADFDGGRDDGLAPLPPTHCLGQINRKMRLAHLRGFNRAFVGVRRKSAVLIST